MDNIAALSPLDGHQIARYPVATPATIALQMQAARGAAQAWAETTIAVRLKRLAPLKRMLLDDADRITELLVRSTGKVRTDALLAEIYPLLEMLRYYEKHAAAILRYRGVSTSPFAFPAATAGIERRPYGVVAVISPWNYPLQLSLAPMLAALVAGNAVVLKPSELCLPVGEMLIEIFGRLDLPPGLVQWVAGAGDSGAQLIDAGPDLVCFTGGLQAGRAVMQRAAQLPIPVILELGGKDPMLVFADAPLQRACDGALYGAFCNSGQACISVERLYVQQECYPAFVDMLRAGVAQLKVGHGAQGDLGAMASERQLAVIEAHYHDALAQGAKASGPLRRDGSYLWPVLLWDVHHGMRVMREETFGPLLPVMPFATEQEAVRLANDSDAGLNASVWSGDPAKAIRVVRQLQAGMWAINDVLKNAGHAALPFGGVKRSGFGRYRGAEGLRNFTYPVSGLTSRSRHPKEPNWFPYSDERYAQFKAYLDCLYGDGPIYRRIARNWTALQTFREYAGFNWQQLRQNLQVLLPWQQDN